MKIIPAILVKKYEDLENRALQISTFTKKAQIDICDGQYAKSKTWPFYKQEKSDFINESNKNEDLFLPSWELVDFAADIMCEDSSELAEILCRYGFVENIFHFRSLQNEAEAKNISLKDLIQNIVNICEKYEVKFCLALDINTDINIFKNILNDFKNSIFYIQIMGIDKIGYQGQKFEEKVLDIISDFKSEFPDVNICVDGGVGFETAAACADAGADMLVVGSALGLDTDDYIFNFKAFKNIDKV